jgi:hypothetical protein
MSVTDRNRRVTDLLDRLFQRAERGAPTVGRATSQAFDVLFGTTSWGFREIVLLITVARLLDGSYRASSSFYVCNPRALYEGPMVEALRARRIPHRKSGPLNVAKATVGINAEWATQRRPAEVASTVVTLVRSIERMSPAQLEEFAVALHRRFLDEAERVSTLEFDVEPQEDPTYLWDLCRHLIVEVPDSGNTPQRIVGLLLEAHIDDEDSDLRVCGHNDRASVTSTTSKKPGDITEEQPSGEIVRTYEVTVKPFGDQRVRESFDTVKAHEARTHVAIPEVLVLCRARDVVLDVERPNPESAYHLGSLTYEDVRYHFLDIFEWIMAQLDRMSPDARRSFHEKLHAYVSEPNTSEKVKRFWIAAHAV